MKHAAASGFAALVEQGLVAQDGEHEPWAARTNTVIYGDARERLVMVTFDPVENELLVRVSAPGVPAADIDTILPAAVVRKLRLTHLPKLTTGVLTARLEGIAAALLAELPELRAS